MEQENTTGSDKYKALFLSSRDAVMTLEPPSWKFTSGNPATVAMFGAKDEADFLRYPPWELSPKLQPDGMDSMGKAKEMIDEAMEKGSNLFQWSHKRINGEEFPAEVLLSRVEQGGKTYLHALVRDISDRKKLEAKVEESAEQKFKIIFDNTNDGMILVETETRKFVLGNKSICSMLGYSLEELQLLGIEDIHPKESLKHVLEEFEKQTKGEIQVARGLPVVRKDGTVFYADVNTSSVIIGGVKYGLGVFRDITEQRKVEAEREQFLKFFQLSTDIMVIADPLGNFKRVNPACLTILGYAESELLGRPFIDFVYEVDKKPTADEMQRQMKVGSSLDFENRYVCKDGKILWLSWRANYEKDDGITYATARNITEQKENQRKIKQLANLYEILMKCDQAIVKSKSDQELLTTVCEDVIHFDSIKMAWMGIVDEKTKKVQPVASAGSDMGYLKSIEVSVSEDTPLGRGPTGTAIRENRPYWCQDFQHDPATIPWQEKGLIPGWKSSAALPIGRGGKVVGALTLYSSSINSFDEDARRLLTEMASEISRALDNLDLEKQRNNSEIELRNKFEEIEKLNKFMVGREIKMAELKGEIEKLKKALSEKT